MEMSLDFDICNYRENFVDHEVTIERMLRSLHTFEVMEESFTSCRADRPIS